jgi:hypothetical protein
MGKSSIISLKEVINGTLQIEIRSSNECIVMNLRKKYCEPINELGEILFDIYDYYNENPETNNSKSSYLFWECESCQYSLEFILNPNQIIDIKVSHCPDIFAGIHTESELKLSIQTTLKDLMENLLEEMKNTLLNYGFIGYKNRWQQQDFPVATFLKLYNLLHGKYKDPTSLPRCIECLQKIVSKEFIFTDN